MALPASIDRVEVRGSYVDLTGAPVSGTLEFTISPAALIAIPELTFVMPLLLRADIDRDTGRVSILLPATDDPDVTPTAFTYQVTERLRGVTGRTYSISVPIAARFSGIDLAAAALAASSSGVPQTSIDGGAPDTVFTDSVDGGTP